MSYTWSRLLKAAIGKVEEARVANTQAQFTIGLPREEKDKAEGALYEAEEAVAKLCYNAAQDLLLMLRYAVRLFPDDFRDLLREGMRDRKDLPREEDTRREQAIALYLRIREAGGVVTKDGVKGLAPDSISALDRKLIPQFKDELLHLAGPNQRGTLGK